MTEELIAKLEALEEPEYYNIFGDVFLLLNPKPHERKERAEYYAWYNKNTSFTKKLRCQAWESAAIMLVPEGYGAEMHFRKKSYAVVRKHEPDDNPTPPVHHNHPAIALLICILKAKEPVE